MAGGAWTDCLRADIRALMDCDTLALLPGWESSQGAHLELHIAHRVGIKVVMAADIANACHWVEDSDACWNTTCGKVWSFFEGGPFENEAKYCHGCGKPVVEVAFEQEEEAMA